ncbi:myosin-11-like [Quercus lobata]|uniref:myosin-11-like n=1 Tax=Quercus lobata TaxID=97700 RepID=UPI00124839D0|nr:myosin-11-like [Quercus lobata]
MADLRSMRKHEIFLSLKRDLALNVQAAHRVEEIVNNTHQQMKDEKARRIAAVDTFKVAEKRIQDLNTQLIEANRARKSAEAVLQRAENQAETQRKQLRQAEVASKENIKALKKKLEEAEKVKDQAEQDGYDVGVAKTEKALSVEVSEVCRSHCLQVWNEALKQAGVEASSAFRRAESAGTASEEVDTDKDSSTKALLSPDSPSKEAEQPGVAEKETNTTKGVAPDATKPPTAPKDFLKEKEASHKMEIVLETLPVPTKENLKGKGPESSAIEPDQTTKAPAKDKLVIEMK